MLPKTSQRNNDKKMYIAFQDLDVQKRAQNLFAKRKEGRGGNGKNAFWHLLLRLEL